MIKTYLGQLYSSDWRVFEGNGCLTKIRINWLDLITKKILPQLLNKHIENEFGREPFFIEAINKLAKKNINE